MHEVPGEAECGIEAVPVFEVAAVERVGTVLADVGIVSDLSCVDVCDSKSLGFLRLDDLRQFKTCHHRCRGPRFAAPGRRVKPAIGRGFRLVDMIELREMRLERCCRLSAERLGACRGGGSCSGHCDVEVQWSAQEAAQRLTRDQPPQDMGSTN